MDGVKKAEHCMACGTGLEYMTGSEELTCGFCGKKELGHIRCPKGHFICEACHGKDAMKAIEDVVFKTDSKDPAALAELLMSHPSVPMLGCEHAFITGGALMAALRNSWSRKITEDEIREVFTRTARQALGGYCGLTGVCGIVPAVGACFSVFLGARCGSDNEQKITMDAIVKVTEEIKNLTGPSCCKAYVRGAVAVAAKIFEEKFGIALPVEASSIVCAYTARHPHGCRKEKCPYYKFEAKDYLTQPVPASAALCRT